MNTNVIPGFESLSPQRCFDMAAEHVLKNGKASVNERGVCSYRGIGCAASPFLTEAARKKLLPGWRTLVNDGDVPEHNKELIMGLQSAHDGAEDDRDSESMTSPETGSNAFFIRRYIHRMESLARYHNLNPGVLYPKLTHQPS